jgi:hypothetical protein
MKTFWIILLLLAAASGAYYFMPERDLSREIARVNEGGSTAITPGTTGAPSASAPVTPTPADTATPATDPATIAQTPTDAPDQPITTATTDVASASPTTPTTPTTEAPADAAPAAVIGSIGGFEVAAGKIEQRDANTLVVDDRHTIVGDGSEEKPFQITWELLTSVEQDFDPHSGRRQIPQRVAMLDGKWVSLSGWVAFPMAVQQPKELLLMLNQWDGCCIGVPPTPYDAIEVVLDNTVTGEARFTSTGAIKGRFGLKPYVVGDWLVGLYVIDQGALSPQMFSGGES